MNLIAKWFQGQVPARAYSGPQEAYIQELSRKSREKDQFVRSSTAEELILQSWELSVLYARHVLVDRWMEFEAVVEATAPTKDINNIRSVFRYADVVLQDRFVAGEKHVANSADVAVDYAVHILKRPWVQEGEPGDEISQKAHENISNDIYSSASSLYAESFLKPHHLKMAM